MARVGIMIEGQEGLSWDRWRRICQDTDRLGFASLRRSDHFVSLNGRPDQDCIECWISLALAAEWTKNIEIGPMVSPMTFRPAALLARMAAAVDIIAAGRLILGVGAGWNEHEHREFGIPFYIERQRFDMLEAGVKVIRETWSRSNPKPVRNPIPILLGGKGLKRTLPLVAREGSEWNYSKLDADGYRQRRDLLEQLCRDAGRDPTSIRHSVMSGFLIGRNRKELLERAAQVSEVIDDLNGMTPEEVLENRKDAWLVGTPEQIAERMREFARLGIDLFMLQHFLLDDVDALELVAKELIPAVA